MRKLVLYATNGAEPARKAGVLLRRVADPAKVQVTVNVCDSIEFAFPQQPWRYGEERRARPGPDEVASQETAMMLAAGFEADVHIGTGIPAEQVLHKVSDGGYEVTVMGAGSARWVDNYLLGSTSTRVLHHSPTSVLIVHRFEDHSGPVRVLVATDASADAMYTVQVLVDLADPAKVEVTIVSVADAVPRVPRLIPDALPPGEVAGYLGAAAQRGADLAAAALQEAGFEVVTASRAGEPVHEILKLAEQVDLVVCGARGMGATDRLLLGSVCDQLARLAPATLVGRRDATTSAQR